MKMRQTKDYITLFEKPFLKLCLNGKAFHYFLSTRRTEFLNSSLIKRVKT